MCVRTGDVERVVGRFVCRHIDPSKGQSELEKDKRDSQVRQGGVDQLAAHAPERRRAGEDEEQLGIVIGQNVAKGKGPVDHRGKVDEKGDEITEGVEHSLRPPAAQ
jgi:hypothetical protein